jgi:ABC-2 type transport system permease protein
MTCFTTPPEFAAIANTAVMPLMLLSGLLLPMTLAPGWLNGASRVVPFRYTVDAVRQAFLGHYASGTVAIGAAVTFTFAAACLLAGTRLLGCRNHPAQKQRLASRPGNEIEVASFSCT